MFLCLLPWSTKVQINPTKPALPKAPTVDPNSSFVAVLRILLFFTWRKSLRARSFIVDSQVFWLFGVESWISRPYRRSGCNERGEGFMKIGVVRWSRSVHMCECSSKWKEHRRVRGWKLKNRFISLAWLQRGIEVFGYAYQKSFLPLLIYIKITTARIMRNFSLLLSSNITGSVLPFDKAKHSETNRLDVFRNGKYSFFEE